LARIGLVYEDEPIRIAVEILIPKILGEAGEFEPLKGGPWPGIVGLTPNLLQVLAVRHIYNPLNCVVVVFDANNAGFAAREERVERRVGERRYSFGEPIYHAIVRQIETWLLGDPEAINAAAGRNIPPVGDPESLLDPKRHLIQVLKNQGGAPYDRNFVRAAASIADISRIATSCPGFRRFMERIRGCGQQSLPLQGYQ